MTGNIKHYFTLVLTTFMGPADRGSVTHSESLRRKRDANRQPQPEPKPTKAEGPEAPALEYMI